jgi:hypothetical protein
MSSVLLGDPTREASRASTPPAPPVPASPPGPPPAGGAPQRNNTLTVIAGVGVLLLAMGVGVLIGRSGSTKPAAAPAQVITVGGVSSTGAGSTAPSEATFTSDWPSGTSGYTVQLQTLPESGTSVSAVEAAKSAASAKGAQAVGALKSEEFSSLTAGSYVVYSGDFHTQAQAGKALTGLKKSFPGAKTIKVSNGSSGSGSSTGGSGSSPSGGSGSNESHPAPSSVLKSLKGSKGKSYEEKAKNLPDVVETG